MDRGGSSYFKDVTIISDTNIWAVGAIYTDSVTYNAAHWNGINWELKRIFFYTICGQQNLSVYPLSSVIAFGSTDVWMAMDGSQIVRWNGQTQSAPACIPVSAIKLWGTSTNNVYAVGNGGGIAHYNGTSWVVQQSGTTTDLYDVWGNSDGNVVWVCGYTFDGLHSVFLKYENNQWHTLWSRDVSTPVLPFGYTVASVWRSHSTYVISTNGLFRVDSDTTRTKLSNGFSSFTPRLRGNADNDFIVAGDDAFIWHYNGVGGKELNGGMQTQPIFSCDMKKNTIVAVGSDFGSFPNKALIYLGRR